MLRYHIDTIPPEVLDKLNRKITDEQVRRFSESPLAIKGLIMHLTVNLFLWKTFLEHASVDGDDDKALDVMRCAKRYIDSMSVDDGDDPFGDLIKNPVFKPGKN